MKVLFFALALYSMESHARRVMLTSFEPFGGRPDNGSHLAAQGLVREEGVEYIDCLLPVEFDKAAAKAKECYEAMNPKPDMVMSLGEGGCDIRLETRAMNFDDAPGFADNGGTIREGNYINVNSIPFTFLTLPVADMYCSTRTMVGPPSRTSIDAGYYVCNNTAFHLSQYFRPLGVPYGFVHVPVTGCKGATIPETVSKLHSMTTAALNVIESEKNCDVNNPITVRGIDDLMAPSRALCEELLRAETEGIYEVRIGQHRRGDIATPSMDLVPSGNSEGATKGPRPEKNKN